MGSVVAIGSANVDVIFRVSHLVAAGETLHARDVSEAAGGKSANQAAAEARLGAPARFVGCVGDDDHGRLALRALGDAGVDTAGVRIRTDAPTGSAFICVDDASENTIVLSTGANDLFSPDDLDDLVLSPTDVVTLCCEPPAALVAEAARRAHDASATVIMNASPVAGFDPQTLQWTDILVVNAAELAALVGGGTADDEVRAARSRLGVSTLVVTLGAAGAVIARTDVITRIPGHRVEAVDTTGCGDAFLGALAAGLVTGHAFEDAARRANAAAALAATAPGAQPSYPTAPQLERDAMSSSRV
ncbi:ribokinase [Microbacterium elymi]|uniref:Ribokinase n=1 Tax=Microbacterium elymi TaxID=2909587 RepID=A0ABY5NHI4_9MICO|nr:ribokinase [Microbacterium elymi]UUT34632.1 ribokinase [Microbacterium elymi]